MKKLLSAALLACAVIFTASPAAAQVAQAYQDTVSNRVVLVPVTPLKPFPVTCPDGTCSGGGGGGTTTVKATAAAPTYVEGSTTNPLSSDLHGSVRFTPLTPAGVAIDLSSVSTIAGVDGTTAATNANPLPISDAGGSITVDGTVAATQSGTWNVTNVSGTVSLPTGAATEASLVKLPVAQASTTSGQSGPLVQCAVTTAAPTYTTAQTNPLSCDTTGTLRVTGGGVAQGSTTSGQSGALMQGAVLTGQPIYTTAQTSPVSITTKGNLRTAPCDDNGCVTTTNSSADGGSAFGRAMEVKNFPLIYNGSTYDRQRGIAGSFGSAVGVPAVEQAGSPFSNITTATTTTVKSGAGILHKINIGLCVAAATVTIYDNTAGSGTKIGTYTCPATVADVATKTYDLAFATGLTIVTSGATDITVSYR